MTKFPWSREVLPGRPTICPQCGSKSVLRIIFGLSPRDIPGETFYGGCVIRKENWHCAKCGHEWEWHSEKKREEMERSRRIFERLGRPQQK